MFELVVLSESTLTWTEAYNTPVGFRFWLLEKYKKHIQDKIEARNKK